MFNEWTVELKAMADRIISMREQLFDALKSRGNSSLPAIWLNVLCEVNWQSLSPSISFMILY